MCPSEQSSSSSGSTAPPANAASAATDRIVPVISAAIAEVRLLLDHIGGLAKSGIGDLKLARPNFWQPAQWASGDTRKDPSLAPESAVGQLDAGEILARFAEIVKAADAGRDLTAFDIAFVILLRDKLNEVANPASGMTVAYTWMVTGTSFGPRSLRPGLAEKAYPALARKAFWHRFFIYWFILLAVFVTTFAVWEATKVALGKSLLASLQELRTQQVTLDAAKMKLQAAGDSTGQWKDPAFRESKWSLRLCENARLRFLVLKDPYLQQLVDGQKQRHKAENFEVTIFSSPAEQDICDKDQILATNFGLFYQGLKKYNENWPGLVGHSFEVVQNVIDRTIWILSFPSLPERKAEAEEPIGNDIEWVIVARLLVLGNYVLPVVFAVLGAIAYVMVDHTNKVRRSLLSPRDLGLAGIRMVLGFLVGACIGLLYSSSVPVSQPPGAVPSTAGLLNTLTLSASGVAFLAGFGVEGVFSMLESMIRRLFPTDTEAAPK